MADGAVILWFRRDLRLTDNAAVTAAVETGRPVVPLFVLDDGADGLRPLGGASKWWLDKSLRSLDAALRERGSRLLVRRGRSVEVLPRLAREVGAVHAVWGATHEPGAEARDTEVDAALIAGGLTVERFAGSFLNPPGSVLNGSGEAYRVFTPYWRVARARVGEVRLQPAPHRLTSPEAWPASEPAENWGLHPARPDWSTNFDWTPGEAVAEARLEAFLDDGLAGYRRARDLPHEAGSTRLSPHLTWGEIGPRQIWCAAHRAVADGRAGEEAREKLLSEVAWRDFNWSLLAQTPTLPDRNHRSAFDRLAVREAPEELEAWRRGRTGYPIVDAGMRQLWVSGWMHNRVRMVAASFLVKHLLIDWREGERWFWDTLVDADPANNALNWQWIAGSGPDASPFHRIFNPVTQGEKFDTQAAYVRRWVPELAGLTDAVIHRPWEASPAQLEAAGVRLGETYPRPLVDHAAARTRALQAGDAMRGAA